MRRILLALCIALASGCAGLEQKECASDWSDTGAREGVLGASGMAERHAARCPNFDAAKYREGYDRGFAQRARPMV